MVPEIRKIYNRNFTTEKFDEFCRALDKIHPRAREFRLAETPVFVPEYFASGMLDTCEAIVDLMLDPHFLKLTENSVPPADRVPGQYSWPGTMVFDFGICQGPEGRLEPRLVELQGFPSLYAFQAVYPDLMRRFLPVPQGYTQYLGGHDRDSFTSLFREVLLAGHEPENVILLEIKPHEQKTRIDFYCTRDLTGIEPVCITELIREGRNIYYMRHGKKTQVRRIYNRMIFDELHARNDLVLPVNLTEEMDVEWVAHPDWFYRLSKFTLPLITHPFVPRTYYLQDVKQLPGNLEDYVLKPLFSFAGQGVVIDVQREDIDRITDPSNWILQEKVTYADIIETPDIPAKAEIRIMYLWHPGKERPEPVINLARLSKGKMIGTRFNKDREWVGGSVAFFER